MATLMWHGRVLLLEDEEAILFGVREFLGARGYCVRCARSAAEAQEELSAAEFDVLIADLRLSPADPAEGLDVVEQVRRAHPRTRILVLTAGGDDLQPVALGRGAHVFLQKPQPLERIAEIVRGFCQDQQPRRSP